MHVLKENSELVIVQLEEDLIARIQRGDRGNYKITAFLLDQNGDIIPGSEYNTDIHVQSMRWIVTQKKPSPISTLPETPPFDEKTSRVLSALKNLME